jgi:hypothetical protein
MLKFIKQIENRIIEKLKEYETLEYRKNNSKEKIEREKKIATENFRSILEKKQKIIDQQNNNMMIENKINESSHHQIPRLLSDLYSTKLPKQLEEIV